jgi:hypothetical protein
VGAFDELPSRTADPVRAAERTAQRTTERTTAEHAAERTTEHTAERTPDGIAERTAERADAASASELPSAGAASGAGAQAGAPPPSHSHAHTFEVVRDDADPADVARYRALVRVRDEMRFLGIAITAHPVSLLRAEAEAFGALPIAVAVARARHAGGRPCPTRLIAIVAGTRALRFGSRRVRFVTLEDESGIVDGFLASPPAGRLPSAGPWVVDGVLDAASGARTRLVVRSMRPLAEVRRLRRARERHGNPV